MDTNSLNLSLNNLSKSIVCSDLSEVQSSNAPDDNIFVGKKQELLDTFDRRQQNIPVENDKRSGLDRRTKERMSSFSEDVHPVENFFKNIKNETTQISTKINELDKAALESKDAVKTVFTALSPISPLRRISSVPEKIEDKDYLGTTAAIGLAGVMLPEDLKDMKDTWNQIAHNILPDYDYKNCQAPFRFFRGTLLEKPINKMGKYGYYAHQFDKSIAETKLGAKIAELLKVEEIKAEATGRLAPKVIKDGDNYVEILGKVYAQKLEGPKLGKLIYRAMQRTTVIGALVLAGLGLPSIIKAFNKSDKTEDKFKNAGKQTLKAGVSSACALAGIGLIGALGARKGPAGSLIGIGFGSVVGSFVSNKINENFDTSN